MQTVDSGHWVKGVTQEALVGSVVAQLHCVKPRHRGNCSCYPKIGVVSSSLCEPSLCGPALFQSASWLIHYPCNLCVNRDRIIRPMYTLSCAPQLPLKLMITSYHHLAVSKPWTHHKLLEDGHDKTSWFGFETLYLWTLLAEWGVIQMCCSTASFQVQWMCSVEFCLIFSTFSVPASAAVNLWSIFHQRKWCCLQLWFDLYSCQTGASLESSKSVQPLVLGTGKAANSASGRTLPGTRSSSVTPTLQTSPSASKIEQDR